jgi:hypothetical protein
MDTHHRLLFALGATALLLLGPGCQQLASVGEWIGDAASEVANAHDRDVPYDFEVDGPVALDVDSFNGDVTVECDPSLAIGRLRVTRVATHGAGRRGESKDSLASIHYTADLVPGDIGQVLQVRTWSDDDEPHFQRAHVKIELPEVDGVFIRTSNGDVEVIGIEGETNITTSYGRVRVMTNLPMFEPVTLINNSGSIDYRVRGESTGSLDCRTLRGKVRHRVRFGELIVHEGTSYDRLHATLNSGSNPVVMRAADGDISIAVVAEPTEVGVLIIP